MIKIGTDWDINSPIKAYVVYWNCEHRVICERIVHAETVWPLTLVEAIIAFRPEFARGVNINFQFIDGTFSATNVMEF